MSDQTPSDALNEWFRHIGTGLSNEDYEDGIKAIHDLTESNRRLANQIVGYGDRMQQTIAGIRKDAKVEALREAAYEWAEGEWAAALMVADDDVSAAIAVTAWLNHRADNLEAS